MKLGQITATQKVNEVVFYIFSKPKTKISWKYKKFCLVLPKSAGAGNIFVC